MNTQPQPRTAHLGEVTAEQLFHSFAKRPGRVHRLEIEANGIRIGGLVICTDEEAFDRVSLLLERNRERREAP